MSNYWCLLHKLFFLHGLIIIVWLRYCDCTFIWFKLDIASYFNCPLHYGKPLTVSQGKNCLFTRLHWRFVEYTKGKWEKKGLVALYWTIINHLTLLVLGSMMIEYEYDRQQKLVQNCLLKSIDGHPSVGKYDKWSLKMLKNTNMHKINP